MIVIIDYGMGNVGSIHNMLNKIGVESTVTSNIKKIENADRIIFPGVGAFDQGMKSLNQIGVQRVLNQKVVIEKTPILGICLGMQLMTQKSEEGVLAGLGWINAETVKFKFSSKANFKVPHICWNQIAISHQNEAIARHYDLCDHDRFYFVHSYYVDCKDPTLILTETQYGIPFCSSFVYKNIMGVQFHPEKSHRFGMKLLKSFATWDGND